MRHRPIYVIPLILGLLVLNLGAKDAGPKFIAPASVNVTALLADPPTLGSEENQAEVSLLLELQKSRTDEDKARILAEDDLTVFAFADVLGPWFNAKDCPETAALFPQIEADSKFFTDAGKKHWNRPRPYTSVKELNPSGKLEKSASYPSGHSTRGTLYAEILADIFPDKRAALMARAREIGWDRVIAGVHYPSDIAAGRVLGHALGEAFVASPDFKPELDKIKAELQQASQPVAAH